MTSPKIYCATPLRNGEIHMATAMTMVAFWRDPNFTIAPTKGAFNGDVYRVRSRIARHFLATDATHLFFLDADVSAPADTLQRLVCANLPIVAAPYPKKHMRLGAGNYEPTWYPLGALEPHPIDGGEAHYVKALVPMGCTLIRREVIERLTEQFSEPRWDSPHRATLMRLLADTPPDSGARDALDAALRELDETNDKTFGDVVDDCLTVAIFDRELCKNPRHPTHPKNLWPEDFSFCLRAARLGVHAYVHMGCKAFHHEGGLVFPSEGV